MYRNFLLLSMIAILIFSTGTIAAPGHRADTSGAQSFQAVCREFGVEAGRKDFTALAGVTDLEKFVPVLQKKGLHAVEVKIGIDGLSGSKLPAIAMLWDGRFVAVKADSTGKLSIIDPPTESKPLSFEELKSGYIGLAVVVSRDESLIPKPQTKGPDLRCEWYVSDFGAVNAGDKIERTVKLRNVGTEDLNISYARATCGCAVAALSENKIPPGKEAEIKVKLDTKGRLGVQHHKVYINSDDPVTPIAQVQLVGTVISEKVSLYPRSIDFGILRKGESPYREVNVYDSGGYDLRVTKVSSDSRYLNCAITTVGEKDSPRYLLYLALAQDTPPGDLKAKLTITTTHPKEPIVEVPVIASVKEDLGNPCIPVNFGGVKRGESAEVSILIVSPRNETIKVIKIDNPFKQVTVRAEFDREGKGCRVTLMLDKDAPAETFTGEVVLHTSDLGQPLVKLSVSGRAE